MSPWSSSPLPVKPTPCGEAKDDSLVRAWEAQQGRCPGEAAAETGVCLLEAARNEFAALPFTLECWVMWPAGTVPLREPAIIAEAAGTGWTWSLGFDHAGALKLVWRAGEAVKVVAGEILIDSVFPDAWYHVALVLSHRRCALAVTPSGEPMARWSGGVQGFALPGRIPAGDTAALSLARGIKRPEPSPLHIGSAAWHSCARGVADFPALGGAPLPDGLVMDQDLEYGTLGRVFALSEDDIVFCAGPKAPTWFAFRVLGAGGRTLRFLHFPSNDMGIAVFVSEDGGSTWGHPNGGAWRAFEQPELRFIHTFASEEAIVVTSPPVTVAMADEWLEQAAVRFDGRIHEVGRSREGRPIRVLEVGAPDAPWVYLQAGQHSMLERLGFFMVTSAFETAAADAELLARTRWLIMPLVNVDSFGVSREDGNMNRFWGKEDGPPTIKALERFLRREAERTGGLMLLDWHGGTVWRGHTLLANSNRGYSDPSGYWDSHHLRGREAVHPEFEGCLRAEGIHYTALNSYARMVGVPKPGMAHHFGRTLPDVEVTLIVELSAIVATTPEGTEPVTLENLRADGVRWYHAIRRYVSQDRKEP